MKARKSKKKQIPITKPPDKTWAQFACELKERAEKAEIERDEARAMVDWIRTPSQVCLEDRQSGGIGCGSCAICCKELREEVEYLKGKAVPRLQTVPVQSMAKAATDPGRADIKKAIETLDMFMEMSDLSVQNMRRTIDELKKQVRGRKAGP